MTATVTSRALVLAVILLLALALRLVNLDERNLWYDEAFAILFADAGLDAMLYGTLTPVEGGAADVHPLLYYVTLGGWMELFGNSAFVARLWSVIAGVAAVGMVYLIGRDLFGDRSGRVGALVTAIAPFHVQYAQEARMYSLLALWLAAATWCFVRAARAERAAWRWWMALGVLAAAAMYTQQLAAFYLAALALAPGVARRRALARGLALAAGAALFLYLPWLAHLPAQWGKLGAYYWVPVPNLARFLLTLRTFFTAGVDLPMPTAAAALGGAVLVASLLVFQVVMQARRAPARTLRRLGFVLWLAAIPPVLMWLVSQVRPVYLERALLPSGLMLYVALGWLLANGGLPRPVAALLVVALLALAAIGLWAHYTWDRFPNSPFRQVALAIAADWQTGDLVLHQSKLSALPMTVYAPELDQRFIRDAPGSPEDTLAEPTRQVIAVGALDCVRAAGPLADRLWVVAFDDVLRQAAAAGRDDIPAAFGWLDAHYTAVERHHFNDLSVTLYAGPDEAARLASCEAA